MYHQSTNGVDNKKSSVYYRAFLWQIVFIWIVYEEKNTCTNHAYFQKTKIIMHDLWGANFLLYWYVPNIFGHIDISISYLL